MCAWAHSTASPAQGIYLPAPTQTFVGLLLGHLALLVTALTVLTGKSGVASAAVTLFSLSWLFWRWRGSAVGYRLVEDQLWPADRSGRRLRVVGLRRFGPWWILSARAVDGTATKHWVERWRLLPACDWRLAVLANGWTPKLELAHAPLQEGVARLR